MDEQRVDACGVELRGAISRDDLPAVCAGLVRLLAGRTSVDVLCDVGALSRPDIVVVELLARLQLIARRRDSRLVLRDASAELLRLVALAGLSDALPARWSPREVRGEAEHREQRGVEEVRDAADPAV